MGFPPPYLLTGQDRFRLAAKAGIEYQRETFRNLSHDGERCIWNFGKRKIRLWDQNYYGLGESR